jgi:iron complex outermembrane receptor protein
MLAGARWQHIDNRTGTTDNTTICGPFSSNAFANVAIPCNFNAILNTSRFVSERVTPRVGLLWRPLEWLSLYGNFSQSYSPNYDGKLVFGTNDPTPPSAGEQEEGGVKLALFDNRLQATAAYYHLVKTNIPIGVPNDFNHVMLVGQGRSQGPELDIQGELLPGWSINLAYANTDAITTKSNPLYLGVPVVGQPIPFVPRNVGSLSSAYEFKDGQMKGLRVGARYDYTGYLPFFHTANDGTYIYGQSTPSYGLVGLFSAYAFNLDPFKIVAQLNVSNLLDKTYFMTGGLGPQAFDSEHPGGFAAPFTNPVQVGWNMPGFNFNVIGAPRMFRGSIKVSF